MQSIYVTIYLNYITQTRYLYLKQLSIIDISLGFVGTNHGKLRPGSRNPSQPNSQIPSGQFMVMVNLEGMDRYSKVVTCGHSLTSEHFDQNNVL